MRKVMLGFALLIGAALVGVVILNEAKVSADDAPQWQAAKDNVQQSAVLPEAVPSALPVNELALYPDEYGHCILSDGCSYFSVIVDGRRECVYIDADPRKSLDFQLRNDGWTHASVRCYEKCLWGTLNFRSVTILCPDERTLIAWQKWCARGIRCGSSEEGAGTA